MKSETEIRNHAEYLKTEYPLGLSLHRTGFIEALEWVLGESDEK